MQFTQFFIPICVVSLSLSACAKPSANFHSVPAAEKNNQSFATTAPPPKTLPNLPAELQTQLQNLVANTKKNMVFVEGGTYHMGDFGMVHSIDGYPYTSDTDNKPLHKVTLDSFNISAYKASFADFDIYTAATGQEKVGMQEYEVDTRLPNSGAGINWSAAKHYCQWLGEQVGIPMDLPTEAQWEYAARSRGKAYIYGTNNGKLQDGVNIWSYDQRNEYQYQFRTSLDLSMLGKFPPNPLGLYDVATDNYEWVQDWYDADYYDNSPEHNPKGPATGTKKVLRSARPAAGNAIMMGDGMTMRRSFQYPNLKFIEFVNSIKSNLNLEHSVRCASNHTKPFS